MSMIKYLIRHDKGTAREDALVEIKLLIHQWDIGIIDPWKAIIKIVHALMD